MENVNFQQNHLDFMQGDMLMLYTSGVSKAKNKYGEEFSEPYVVIQLNEIIKREHELDRIVNALKESLLEFTSGSGDTSGGVMLLFRYFG